MVKQNQANYQVALRDFQRARKQAAIQQILARLRGEPSDLLRYDTVRQQLKVTGPPVRLGLQEIPLDKIVGSVGRSEDFTRSFLPKKDDDQERWVGVKTAVHDMTGMPPIEVYQIGDSYFVLDGNHRVSIARQLGSRTISAYVTEVKTRVPLTAVDDASEIICKSFYADFLEMTNLDTLRPEVNMLLTFCDEYDLFLDQIEAEYKRQSKKKNGRSDKKLWEDAIGRWYDKQYMPVIEIIREMGILYRFPTRTEADMYVVLSTRHDELEEALGWRVEMETAVTDLIDKPAKTEPLWQRVMKKMLPAFDSGPEPGLWRRQQLARHRDKRLFEHMLVEINGRDDGWHLLKEILDFAKFEQDHLLGLHVVPSSAVAHSDKVQALRRKFEAMCRNADIRGEFAVEAAPQLAEPFIRRASWADLVVVNNTHPVEEQSTRLNPQLKQLVQQCPRPMLVVPAFQKVDFSHACLAYDGSPKANEALFMATYVAGKWGANLTVVTVETNMTSSERLEQARVYIEKRGITAVEYVLRQKNIAEALIEEVEIRNNTFIIMGGFSFRPMRHLVLGSTAEHILRESKIPVLICR